MARRERYVDLQDRAAKAKRREDIKLAKRISEPKPYKPRPSSQGAFYRSLLLEDVIFKVNVISQNGQALLTGSPTNSPILAAGLESLGLVAALTGGEQAVEIRGTGRKPCSLRWFNGDDTPRTYTTDWGTRVVAWGDKTGSGQDAQSHRSAPVGDPSSPTTFDGVRAIVDALMTPQKKTQLLGTRGQMTLIPERGNSQID